ncbi:MAG: cytoplasmic protein [Alphaproteobacteria bacterium]|nr:cytoplasmic protein [Alphaproteobacteria bacterium]
MVEKSEQCGCFHCLTIFSPLEVKDWLPVQEVDEEEFGPPLRREETALCPHCGLHSVIGDSGGYPVSRESLQKVHDYVRQEGGF